MITEIPTHLRAHPLIEPLSKEVKKGIIPLPRKSSLPFPGQDPTDIFIVLDGRIGLQLADPMEARLPLTTALVGAGQLFGFDALNKQPYGTTAIAERDSAILSIPMSTVNELFRSKETFAREFIRQLTDAEEKAQDFRLLIEFGNGMQRVSNALLDYAPFAEPKTVNDKTAQVIDVVQKDVAQRAAFSREETTRALQFLEGQEIITKIPGQMQILDIAALERLKREQVDWMRKDEKGSKKVIK